MKEAVPNYYHKFKCIAEKCKHNCCIGWEIDIDRETTMFYNCIDTEFGDRIRNSIEGDVPHFILQADERCPFLNKNGLCDIFCELGEDALCEICTEHPRFRNFYTDFVEVGLGICCEEAARIIISEKDKFNISFPDNIKISKEENVFFKKRKLIFSCLQNREKSIGERFLCLAKMFGFRFDYQLDNLCELYLSLERLDDKWTDALTKLSDFSFDGNIFYDKDFQIPFEQLSVYFIFRHLEKAIADADYASKVNFALMSCYLLGAVYENYRFFNGEISIEKIADFARMYSAEVEYSEENLGILMRIK